MEKHSQGLPAADDQVTAGLADTHEAKPAVTALDRWAVRTLMSLGGDPPFAVHLWDGSQAYTPRTKPLTRVHIRERRALLRMLLTPDVGFGDSYSDGLVDVDGSLVEFLEALYRAMASARQSPLRRAVLDWLTRPRSNSLATARDNIRHHYDIGNAFYRLWLDREMVYTCAYYTAPEATLEEAQRAKMDHVARKLRLAPGQTVFEAGCGWGALALHLGRHYGVRVRAYNISREQLAHARERARVEGLADRVEFIEDDYRNIRGTCDRFVSVGMLEHVGPEHYRQLGKVIRGCLAPNGLGLIHTIGRNQPAPNNPWTERRIFPGSRPPSLSEMTRIFEPDDFSILDVENLRLHYARTCADWLERFNAAEETVERMFDRRFVRMWRLYLAGSVSAFSTGSLQLFQVVFAPGTSNEVPWTREHLYPVG